MKVAAALALLTAVCVSPVAADSVAPVQSEPSPVQTFDSSPSDVVVYPAPMVTSSDQQVPGNRYRSSNRYSASSQSFIGRWIELERRKNAWIRRQLFGR